jgi:hypothetical protein
LIEDQTPKKENGMTIYKKDLQALNKDIKALERKMEKLIKEFDTGKKATVTRKVTAKPARLKTTTKAPANKTPAKKRPAQPTATDQVLKIINRSKKGVNTATLIKKTGFNQKKISNIIHRAFKHGRLKRVRIGVYVGA